MRLTELKASIARSTYAIDAGAVADAMLRRPGTRRLLTAAFAAPQAPPAARRPRPQG